ncbi:hypothetical protein HY224_01800, partial [Candidatus Uhrbacteria bacterium]|nr:hypothetical protein [Candidatus Uhrbacteria bacterium]
MKILLLSPTGSHSTQRLVQEARRLKLNFTAASVADLNFVSSLDGAEILLGTRNIVEEYDVLIVRDFHPYVAEALTVAKFFSDAGKVVIDQILTEEGYSISKMHDYLVLAEAGLPVPLTYQLYKPLSLRAGLKKLGYPAVLKGDRGSHGEHVYRIKTPKQAKKIFEKYPSGGLLLQEYLPADGDYRVVTLGYKALPVLVKRYPAKNDFRTNFQLTR